MKTETKQDALVRQVTAFGGWQDMLKSLRAGYVPTLRPTRTGRKLAALVEGCGFRVYMPGCKMATRR